MRECPECRTKGALGVIDSRSWVQNKTLFIQRTHRCSICNRQFTGLEKVSDGEEKPYPVPEWIKRKLRARIKGIVVE